MDHLPYTPNVKGSAWDGTHFPAIGSDGVAEVGSILDFHEKSADTADYSLRLSSLDGKLMVNGTDIMNYINNVKSQAGVVAGNVSNANAWWVKLGGTIPLIIQGGTTQPSPITFPVSFASKCLTVVPQLQAPGDTDNMSKNRVYVINLTARGFALQHPQYTYNYIAIGI